LAQIFPVHRNQGKRYCIRNAEAIALAKIALAKIALAKIALPKNRHSAIGGQSKAESADR
jgi:hypothetical protein